MLAPYCEGESAPEEVVQFGASAIDWWQAHGADVSRTGTLVIAPPRDAPDLARFAKVDARPSAARGGWHWRA